MNRLYFVCAVLLILCLCGCKNTSRQAYDSRIELYNADCPLQIDEFTVLTRVYDTPEFMVRDFVINDNDLDPQFLENLAADTSDLKEVTKENWLQNEDAKNDIALISSLNKGIRHHYTCLNSGIEFDVTFTLDELHTILPTQQ